MISSKKDSPILSVIVPVYNVEKYVAECLDSILAQDFNDFEVIVVDDGSTDNSLSIVKTIADRDNRIRTFHKSNGGLSDARNYGLNHVQGEFLTFVDSDDVLLSEKIFSSIIPFFVDQNLDVVQYSVIHEWKSDHSYINPVPVKEYFSKEEIMSAYLNQWIHVSFCDKIFRSRVFDNIRFPKGAISEDIATIPQLVETIDKILVSDIGFYGYRYRKGSISTSMPRYDKDLSALESNFAYYSYAYRFPALRRMCVMQYCPRIWNLMSLARISNKAKDILSKNLYFNLNIVEFFKYTQKFPLSLKFKTLLLFVMNPKFGIMMQKLFTKSL